MTICRLRADYDVVERRFTGKNGQLADLAALLRDIRDDIRLMDDTNFADACVETAGVAADDIADQVRAACGHWPGFTGELAKAAGRLPAQRQPPGGGRVLLITGPAGVGKSTIGFRCYLRCLNAGRTTAYVDLRQIGFAQPAAADDPDNHRLKARNLAVMWRNYRRAGATHLVATGTIASLADLRRYTDELTGADITVVRLRAGSGELRLRVLSRGAGGSWPEPGDPLRGRSAEFLAAAADQAIQAAGALDRSDVGGVAIDTGGLSPDESASAIAITIGWPDAGP